MDAIFLSKFIRTKDYNVDAAFLSLQKYYANVYRNLDFIDGISPSQFKSAFDSNTILLLKHSFNRARVAIVRVRNWMPKDVKLRDLQLASVFLAEHYINNDPDIQRNGAAVIFDLAGLRFEHMKKLSVKEVRRIIQTIQVRSWSTALYRLYICLDMRLSTFK